MQEGANDSFYFEKIPAECLRDVTLSLLSKRPNGTKPQETRFHADGVAVRHCHYWDSSGFVFTDDCPRVLEGEEVFDWICWLGFKWDPREGAFATLSNSLETTAQRNDDLARFFIQRDDQNEKLLI
jgi:hypothetical protein